MSKNDFPKTRQYRRAMSLPIVPKDPKERETYLAKNGILLDGQQSAVHEKQPEEEPEKPSEGIARDPCAFYTRKMPIVPQPLKDVLFEELRNKLRTEEGRLEATVLAVEKEITAKPIDVHRAIAHLERQGLVDRAADIAFRVGNYQEAAAVYNRAGRYAEAGSTCEIAEDYRNAAFFYIRAACVQDDVSRGQRYLQRGLDLLAGKAEDRFHLPKEFLQPSMSSNKRKIGTRDTTQTECTSLGAERCGLFVEAANFARMEGNMEMAEVYLKLSVLVEKIPAK